MAEPHNPIRTSPSTSSPPSKPKEAEPPTTVRHLTFTSLHHIPIQIAPNTTTTTALEISGLALLIGSSPQLRALDHLFLSDSGDEISAGEFVDMLEQAVGEILGKLGLGPEGRGVEVVTDVKISIRRIPVQVEEEEMREEDEGMGDSVDGGADADRDVTSDEERRSEEGDEEEKSCENDASGGKGGIDLDEEMDEGDEEEHENRESCKGRSAVKREGDGLSNAESAERMIDGSVIELDEADGRMGHDNEKGEEEEDEEEGGRREGATANKVSFPILTMNTRDLLSTSSNRKEGGETSPSKRSASESDLRESPRKRSK